jgi:DNA-binding SARP family transcriptional activator
MKLHDLINTAYETFLDQLKQVRIVLLHPQSRYRSVLVARLINDPAVKTFYYAMGPDDINLHAFITGITHDLASQHPTFGRHVHMIPETAYDEENFSANIDEILQTFAQDLREISDEPFLLILDEYDRSDSADDVQRFIERLPIYMPENCALVINSRTLPRLPWVALISQNRAALLQDNEIIKNNFYGVENKDEGQLEIYALGPGFVLMENSYIDAWEGHLPRLLFFFALDRPVVTRSDICRAFWPDLNAEQAVNVFHVTKRRLHKALDMDVLVHEDGYYRVNPDIPVYYDVMEFVEALMVGRNEECSPPEREEAWQKVLNLYRGPFLQGHSDPWIEERRHDFRAGYIEALINMSKVWEKRGKREQSLLLYKKGVGEDLYNEHIHREIMRLYSELGRRSESAAHFNKLTADLKAVNREPEEETAKLHQSIMS